MGAPDTRPGTWGNAGVEVKSIPFTLPPGCIVQIVRVLGDFVAWPDFVEPPPGTQAGTLLSLTPTNVPVCPYNEYLEDGSFLYIQVATSGQTIRVPFDQDGYLSGDNLLHINLAAWLNKTGQPIHMEATKGRSPVRSGRTQ